MAGRLWWLIPVRTDDLVPDMIGMLTSMCAGLYGRRGGARNRAVRAVTATKQGPGEVAL
jgi:putative resolvase